MNKQGFVGNYFLPLLFVILYLYAWIFIFGPVLSDYGALAAADMTGIEALIWRTINIWAGLVPLVLYIMYVGTFGGNQ